MKLKAFYVRAAAAAAAALLFLYPFPAHAADSAALQGQVSAAQREYESAASTLDSMQQQASDTRQQVNDLQSQTDALRGQLGSIVAQLEQSRTELAEAQNQATAAAKALEEKQAAFSARYDSCKQQLTAMQLLNEGGEISLLMQADDLYELLTFWQVLNDLTEHNKQLLDELDAEAQALDTQRQQAEAAADRAASYAPSEGAVLSVNGKSGAVRLNALDVWALPRPVSPKVGQLVRVVKVDASTGALTVDTISTDSLSGLGSKEKELLLKLLGSVSYTDSSAKNALEALKKLWDTTPPTPLPDPDIIPVEKVTLSQHTLELSRGSTADLSASIAPPDATDQTVLWSVSPTDIVLVDAGRVTALKKGSAVVTATSDSKSDSCTVTVTPAVYRIETAHTDSGDIPAWDTYPAKSEFFMPLTAKKAGLLLRSLEFRVKGYMPGKMRTVLRKYGTTTALADKSIDLVRGYNDVVLDMGSIALEKGVEYQLYFAAANNFYPPSVVSSWVAANDCIDIAHGSAYYGDNTTLIFSGTVVLQET